MKTIEIRIHTQQIVLFLGVYKKQEKVSQMQYRALDPSIIKSNPILEFTAAGIITSYGYFITISYIEQLINNECCMSKSHLLKKEMYADECYFKTQIF